MPRPKQRETICPACGGMYFLTTTKYSTKKPPQGDMIQLRLEYQKRRWPQPHKTAKGGRLVCPNCEESMLDNAGRFIFVEVADEAA